MPLATVTVATVVTLVQRLLACLNFNLDVKIYSVGTNERSGFYEL